MPITVPRSAAEGDHAEQPDAESRDQLAERWVRDFVGISFYDVLVAVRAW
jgi:hypothetical protein